MRGDIMTALIHYDAARKALAAAVKTDEVKAIRNEADRRRLYARQAKDRELEILATELRLRAERRLGQLIDAQKKSVGLATGTRSQLHGRNSSGGTLKEPPESKPTLAEAGIDKKLSIHAQKLAAIPEEDFERELLDWRRRVEGKTERLSLIFNHNGTHRKSSTAEEQDVRRFRHSDFNISAIHPWNLGEARSMLGRFLRTCYREWWHSDRQTLTDLLKREIEWLESQEKEE
jgi:hypothetical protein